MTGTVRRKVVVEYDPDPDFSWLEQDCYDLSHPDYEPGYRCEADMPHSPIDPEWYRNPENHVALWMGVYEMGPDDEDWRCVDSLGGIDFFADSNEWATGTFYRLSQLPEGYLRELARDFGLTD